MKSQSNKIFKYPIDAITICAVMLLFQNYILLFLGYVGNRIGFRNEQDICILVYWSVFVIAAALIIVGNYKANILIDARKLILPLVILIVNLFSVLYTSLLNKYIFNTVQFSIIQYVAFLPVVVAVFCNIEDYAKLEYWMTVVARFAWIMPFLKVFLNYTRSGNTYENYDMVAGYELIFCSMILLNSLFKKFNIFDLLLCIVIFFVSLGFGSRGSALAFVVYLCILLFLKFFTNRNRIQKIVFVVVALGIILALILSFDVIILGVKGVFNELGISTRTLDSLLEKSVTEGSNENRRIIYETVVESWKTMPVTGYGILYDRLLVGSYCHNIIIEIITDYGFVLGIALIVLFVFSTVCSLLYDDSNKKSFIVMLACFILTQLLVSGTYLTSKELFALIGSVALSTLNAGKTFSFHRKEKHIL